MALFLSIFDAGANLTPRARSTAVQGAARLRGRGSPGCVPPARAARGAYPGRPPCAASADRMFGFLQPQLVLGGPAQTASLGTAAAVQTGTPQRTVPGATATSTATTVSAASRAAQAQWCVRRTPHSDRGPDSGAEGVTCGLCDVACAAQPTPMLRLCHPCSAGVSGPAALFSDCAGVSAEHFHERW